MDPRIGSWYSLVKRGRVGSRRNPNYLITAYEWDIVWLGRIVSTAIS